MHKRLSVAMFPIKLCLQRQPTVQIWPIDHCSPNPIVWHRRLFKIQQKLILRFHIWNTWGRSQIYCVFIFSLPLPVLSPFLTLHSSHILQLLIQGRGDGVQRERSIFWLILFKLPAHGNNKKQTDFKLILFLLLILFKFN